MYGPLHPMMRYNINNNAMRLECEVLQWASYEKYAAGECVVFFCFFVLNIAMNQFEIIQSLCSTLSLNRTNRQQYMFSYDSLYIQDSIEQHIEFIAIATDIREKNMSAHKFSFYTWKYVQREANQLQENIILKSSDIFQNRQQCVSNAKTLFQLDDSDDTFKRVITKHTRTFLPQVDEVDAYHKLRHVEELLTLCYSLEVSKMIQRFSCELCFGCMFETEDESIHTCNLSEEEQVEKYFSAAINDLKDEHVLDKWMSIIADDPSVKNSFNFLPYQCKDYRDSHFKTTQWLERLKQRTVKMLLLEKRLS